jgi:hypothetical protein
VKLNEVILVDAVGYLSPLDNYTELMDYHKWLRENESILQPALVNQHKKELREFFNEFLKEIADFKAKNNQHLLSPRRTARMQIINQNLWM